MDCACGTQLQLHQRDTCAPTHKERLRKLIRLVRNSKNIELIGNNLSVVPHFYQTLPHCIYTVPLSHKTSRVDSYSDWCISCGVEITYRGPLSRYTMSIGEFTCYGCPSCYNPSGICPETFDAVYKCKERQQKTLTTAVLIFKYFRLPKDIRLLLIPLFRETCSCLKIKQKKT